MSSTSRPSPLESRYPTIDALFQVHRDRELVGPEDCMEFLNRSEIEGFVLREVVKCFKKRKFRILNVADEAKERVEDAAILETLNAMRNSKKIEKYFAEGKFTDVASGRTTPTRRACVGYFIRLGQSIIKLRLIDLWNSSRQTKVLNGLDDEAYSEQDGSLMEPRRTELLEDAWRTILKIARLLVDFQEARMEKSSERYKAEIEALLDWIFGKFDTADAAAEFHGASAKKVREIWENINRVRGGKCPVHAWALKTHPELKDEINKGFEWWYWMKNDIGKDANSLLRQVLRDTKQKSGSGTSESSSTLPAP